MLWIIQRRRFQHGKMLWEVRNKTLKDTTSSRSVVKTGLKEQRRSPNTVMIDKSFRKHDSKNHVNMNLISDLLPVTLSNGVRLLNSVNSVFDRTSYLVGLCVPLWELYNHAFFSSVNADDSRDTKPDSLFPSLCVITEHNMAFIYTRYKSSGLAFYKFSRWQNLLGSVVSPYLQHNESQIRYINLCFRPVLMPVCLHKTQYKWRGHIHIHSSFLSFSQECKLQCPLNIFNQKQHVHLEANSLSVWQIFLDNRILLFPMTKDLVLVFHRLAVESTLNVFVWGGLWD